MLQPARCAGFRRWAVTGSPAATCRPRTQAKRGGNPGRRPPATIPAPASPADPQGPPRPPDRHQLRRETQPHVLPRRRPATVRLAIGEELPGDTTDSLLIARLHASSRPRPCTSAAGSCAPPASAATSSAKNSGGGVFVWRWDIALPEMPLTTATPQLTHNSHPGRGTHNRSICRASATSFADRHRAQSRRYAPLCLSATLGEVTLRGDGRPGAEASQRFLPS